MQVAHAGRLVEDAARTLGLGPASFVSEVARTELGRAVRCGPATT